MTLWSRGAAPAFLRLGAESVLRAYLGAELVYDGTRPVVLTIGPAHMQAGAPVGQVRAGTALALAPGEADTAGPVGTLAAGVAVELGPGMAEVEAPTPGVAAGTALTLDPGEAAAVAPLGSFGGVILVLAPGALEASAPAGMMGAGFARELAAGAVESSAPVAGVSAGAALMLTPGEAEATAPVGAVETPTFAPSGMNKSGTQQVTGTMAQVTGWTADTGTYPGSTISGSALVVNGAGPSKTLTARIAWTPGAGGNDCAIQIKRNGTLLATGAYSTSSPSTVSTTDTVADGDLITIEVRDQSAWAGTSYKATIQAGTGTYVRCLD